VHWYEIYIINMYLFMRLVFILNCKQIIRYKYTAVFSTFVAIFMKLKYLTEYFKSMYTLNLTEIKLHCNERNVFRLCKIKYQFFNVIVCRVQYQLPVFVWDPFKALRTVFCHLKAQPPFNISQATAETQLFLLCLPFELKPPTQSAHRTFGTFCMYKEI
jgi:hypothetical protein